MKIRYYKAASIYTHPLITEYEFNRMKKVEKTYIISCAIGFMIMMFSFPCILISSAKEAKHVMPTVSELRPPVKPLPVIESDSELTLDASYEVKADVGSTTLDTR
jgi:hypothetical protein